VDGSAGRTGSSDRPAPGRLYTGTSGFAYPAWSPIFYPPGSSSRDLLRHYAARLGACELNSTFYRRPTESAIRGWLAATPPPFRFVVKAQRGSSARALLGDPAASLPWLTDGLGAFGERLGAVLFRIPEQIGRDDRRLGAFLDHWPATMPLVVEARHPSWATDETYSALRAHRTALCATDTDDLPEPPTLRLTGDLLYVRLRRTAYGRDELAAWAARLSPFIAAGHDAYVFFRHDETGLSPLRAIELRDLVDERIRAEAPGA
jgi:uncharacterized protein YecE (DUF72 family)